MRRTSVLGAILRQGVRRPEAPALSEAASSLTYGELTGLVSRTAGHLAALGVRPRDRVGLCLRDSADQLAALLAIAALGACAVPLDWRARPAEQARLVEASGLGLLLTEAGAQTGVACPSVALDATWGDAVARAEPIGARPIAWDDAFVISASSGSTGAPKLTQMSHRQYRYAMSGMLEAMALRGRHCYLNTLPLYYAAGRNSCLAHLLRGDRVILYPSLFDAAEYVEAAQHYRASVGVLVPSMLRRLLAFRGGQAPLLGGFASLVSSGAPLAAAEKREALAALSGNFHDRYGTAETTIAAVLRPQDIPLRAASVGRAHSFGEFGIADEADRALPVGAVGRLRYRGPGVASPLPGSEANFRDGWFYPGEIARRDELGFVFLEGRASEVIIRSGAKIHPAEVEAVLCEHPDIVEAAVIGVGGDIGGDEVAAFVVARREISRGALTAHCRARLTAHKVPRQFHFLAQLPKNTAGKIDKPALVRSRRGC